MNSVFFDIIHYNRFFYDIMWYNKLNKKFKC